MVKVLLIIFLLTGFSCRINYTGEAEQQNKNQNTDFRDFYGIAWNGKDDVHLTEDGLKLINKSGLSKGYIICIDK